MRCDRAREGLTGLEIIITIAILLIFMYIAASTIFGAVGSGEKEEGGIIAATAGYESEIIVTDGILEGIQDNGGGIMGIDLVCKDPNPSMMGSCLIPVKLLTGSMGKVDMSTANVIFNYDSNSEILDFTTDSSIGKPSWTIADRSHTIPFMQADEDIYLEPNEIFTLLIYPKTAVPAERKFSLTLSPAGAVPFELNLMVPPSIRSQRIVELLPE